MADEEGAGTPDETTRNEPARSDARAEVDEGASGPTGEGGPAAPVQPHGDPLLASAQGVNDGDDGSRHGWAATTGIGGEGTADAGAPPDVSDER